MVAGSKAILKERRKLMRTRRETHNAKCAIVDGKYGEVDGEEEEVRSA